MRWHGRLIKAGALACLALLAPTAGAEDRRLSSAPLKPDEYHDAALKSAAANPATSATTGETAAPAPSSVGRPVEPVSKFGAQVYRALTEGDPKISGAFMRDAINSVGGICLNVTEFQRVGPKSKLLTHKVRCGKRPLYILTVDELGRMLIDGGDGRVPAMGPTDGEIFNGNGESISGDGPKKPGEGRRPGDDRIPVEDVKRAGPVAMGSVGPAERQNSWLPWIASFMMLVSLFAAFALFLRFNAGSGMAPRHSGAPRRYPSELKDEMIAESVEELPDMWLHGSGVYIVRGRHGKRRVFAHRWNAMLYYRWGYKILQLR
jgi:hypothetical protein